MADASMYLKPKDRSFLTFLYNSEKGEFLGRTGMSWAKVGLFYTIFYIFLAAFFAAMLAVFYQTLDTENNPKYVYGSSILSNPALGFRPRPRKENVESTLIWYRNANEKDIAHWVKELDDFIIDYEGRSDDGQHIRNCNFDQYKKEKEDERNGIERSRQACKFQDTWLTDSQPEQGRLNYCHKAEHWGYSRESPCIIIKMNKIIGWEPKVYTNTDQLPDTMPKDLQEHIKAYGRRNETIPPIVWLSCEGENPADKEYLPYIDMLPYRGFPAYYFPYIKNAAYRSPLVAVQFSNPQPNVLINIECRIWARNIEHNSQNRLGMVHFELLKD